MDRPLAHAHWEFQSMAQTNGSEGRQAEGGVASRELVQNESKLRVEGRDGNRDLSMKRIEPAIDR